MTGKPGGACVAEGTAAGAVAGTDVDALLCRGYRALYEDGDLRYGQSCFDAAYRAAEAAADPLALGEAAIGLAGLWVDEQRAAVAVALLSSRMRRALAGLDPGSPLRLRLRLRLAAHADFGRGTHEAVLALAAEARRSRDATARAEAAHLAHQCMMGPDHPAARRRLADRLVVDGTRSRRRAEVLLGLMWRCVDMSLDGDPRARHSLEDLRAMLAEHPHLAITLVADSMEVMGDIRAGRLGRAEARAGECARRGADAGQVGATGRYAAQLSAIRWYQGRAAELVPVLGGLVNSPVLTAVDHSALGALAVAAAAAGDERRARGALARLRGNGLALLPHSGSWLACLYWAVEAAHLLRDRDTAAEAYGLLLPYADQQMTAGLDAVCFGPVQHALGVAAATIGDPDRAVAHLSAAVPASLAVGHQPATVLARTRLALCLEWRGRPADVAQARRERQLAVRDAAGLGMPRPDRAWPAPALGAGTRRGDGQLATCRRRGREWEVALGWYRALVRHSRGMQYLAVLLANPGQEIRAADLAAGPGRDVSTGYDPVSAQPVLDEVAVREYRGRLAELRGQIDAYESAGDTGQADRLRRERDWLLAELSGATGLGGRARRFTDADERARIAVGKAIRRTLEHIARAEPVLGRHLLASVHTGARCSYRPR